MKRFGLLLTTLLTVACVESNEPLKVVQLVRALEPDAQCAFSLENESWLAGWYDPRSADVMTVQLGVEATGLSSTDVVRFKHLRVCYTDVSRVVTASANHRECDAYFDEGTIFAGIFGETVDVDGIISGCEGEGCESTAMVGASFLSEPVLKDVYSTDFSAKDVSVWFSDAPMAEQGCCRYFYTDLFLLNEEDRVCCENAIWEMGIATGPQSGSPWGEFSPRPSADLVVEFQLIGELPGGDVLTSAWLRLPTTICPGCTKAHGEATGCAQMVGEFCDDGVCEVNGESEACTELGCSNAETPCTGFTYALSGETPEVEGCIVSQMQGITSRCKTVTACE